MDVIRAEHPELEGPTGRQANLYRFGSRQVGPRARQAVVSVMRTRVGDPRLLRSGARVQHGSRGRWIAGAQVAVVTVMLVGASLLARSYVRMTEVPPGVDAHRIVAFWILAPAWRHLSDDGVAQLFARIESELAAVPGVERVASSPDGVPPSVNYDFDVASEVDGRGVVVANDRELVMAIGRVGPGYLETLGIPLKSGRGITSADRTGAPLVAVINETFARLA